MGYGQYDAKRFASKFLEQHLEEERIKKAEDEKQKESVMKKSEKMMSYAKIVKEMHWPEISERKRAEIKNIKKELKQRNKSLRQPRNL